MSRSACSRLRDVAALFCACSDARSEEDKAATTNSVQQPVPEPAVAPAAAPLVSTASDPHAGRRPPPPGYCCHRCGLPGHWIQNCPGPTASNSPAPVSAVIELQSPSSSAAAAASSSLPADLLCPLCHTLYQQAVVMPCCFASYCDECIRQALLWDGNMQCPSCHHKPVDLQQLKPNVQLQKTVDAWKQSKEEQRDGAPEQTATATTGEAGAAGDHHGLSAAAAAALPQAAGQDDLTRALADPSAGQLEHSRRRAGPFRCHRCNEVGHKQAQCPNLPPPAHGGFYPMLPHELQGVPPPFFPGMDPMLAQMQAGGMYDGYGGGWMPSMQEQMMMSQQQQLFQQQQQQQLMGMGGGAAGGAWPGWGVAGMGGMYGGGAGPMGLMQQQQQQHPPFMQQQSNTMPMQPLPPFHHPHPPIRPPYDTQLPQHFQPSAAGQRPFSPPAQPTDSDVPQHSPTLNGVQPPSATTSSSDSGAATTTAEPSDDTAAASSSSSASSSAASPSEALLPSARPAAEPASSSSAVSVAAATAVPSSSPPAPSGTASASWSPATSSSPLTVQSYCYLPSTWNGATRSLLLLTLGPPPVRRVLHASSLLPGSAFRLSSASSRLLPGVHLLTASGIPPRGASSSLLLSLLGLEEWRRREGEEGAVRMAADWKAQGMQQVVRWMRGELRLEETSAALPASAAPAAPAGTSAGNTHRKVEADANGGLRMRVTRREDRQEEDSSGSSKRKREEQQEQLQEEKSGQQDTVLEGKRPAIVVDAMRDRSAAVTVDADDRYRPPAADDNDENDVFALVMRE